MSSKGLWMLLGLAVTALVGMFALSTNKSNIDVASQVNNKTTKMATEMLDSDKSYYQREDNSGTDVINAISKFSTEKFGIIVKTKAGNISNYGYVLKGEPGKYKLSGESKTEKINAQNKEHDQYINPTGVFKGELMYDANDSIVGIYFTQQ